jgi:hypothetical protein
MIGLKSTRHNKVGGRWLKALAWMLFMAPILAHASTTDYLQVGVFKYRSNAENTMKSIEKLSSYPSALFQKKKQDKPYYTVVIQGFKNKQALKTLQRALRRHGIESISKKQSNSEAHYLFSKTPIIEAATVENSYRDLSMAIYNPEFLLKHELHLPTSPKVDNETSFYLSLRDAIFLSLRYNAQLQSSELDRIVQRYSLRIAKNKFEFQYALMTVVILSMTACLSPNLLLISVSI